MLAAYLVWNRHLDSSSAISTVIFFFVLISHTQNHFKESLRYPHCDCFDSQVRRERRFSVETKVQEESVADFQESLKQNKHPL